MRVFILIAVVCLAIALLGATGLVTGVDVTAWAIGGLLAWAIDSALGGYVLAVPRGGPHA